MIKSELTVHAALYLCTDNYTWVRFKSPNGPEWRPLPVGVVPGSPRSKDPRDNATALVSTTNSTSSIPEGSSIASTSGSPSTPRTLADSDMDVDSV